MKDLNLESFKALLFDLDGTLIDSMPLHNRAWIETLKSFDCEMTDEILQQYAGIPNIKTIEIFNERFNWSLKAEPVIKMKEERAQEYLKDVLPLESTFSIVKKYHGKIPMAIVTGGNHFLVDPLLNRLSLRQYFSIVICAEDTNRAKPFPDPFLLAAEKLNILPADCLVFEDGEAGMKAALAGGMSLVHVNADHRLQVIRNLKSH